MNIQYDREEILLTIDKIVKKTMTMDLTWDWPCGVAYYGVSRAYETTKNQEYLDMLVNWTEEYIQLGLPSWNVNACAMGHVLLSLYEATGEQHHRALGT